MTSRTRAGNVNRLRLVVRLRPGLAAAVLSMAAAVPSVAQLNSVPVLAPEIPESTVPVKVYVSYGHGLNDDSGKNTAWTLSADLLLGSGFTVGGALGRFNPPTSPAERSWSWQGGLRAAVAVLQRDRGTDEFVIQLGGGAGYESAPDRKEWNVPVWVAFSYHVEMVGFTIEFSAAPRLAARRTSVGSDAVTQAGGGIAGAARAFIPAGLGLVLSLDWSTWSEATSGGLTVPSSRPLVMGFALRKGF